MDINIDLTGARILIVDDVPANLDILSQSLEADQYNVLVATSGESALKVTAQTIPDLIMLDVMMPGIDGFETCRQLKANDATRSIPVIFLTARDELEGVLEGFRAGGVDYISKPFQKEEVLIRIRTHLERDRLGKELADLNAHLEQKVLERTAELRQKVAELEGKDRIAQHLLTYHPLDETLELVARVTAEVTGLDRIVIYRFDGERLTPIAATTEGSPVPRQDLAGLDSSRSHGALAGVLASRSIVIAGDGFAAIPIQRGEDVVGIIEIAHHEEVPNDALQSTASFALQAAIAMNDAQIQQDAGQWKGQIAEILKLDNVLNIQDLDRLADDSRRGS